MRKSAAVIAMLILFVGPPAWPQDEASGAEESRWAWYMVRPGDTIEGLTTRYLGSRDRWEENAKLNEKRFPNPHKIDPGAHIKLLLPPELPSDGALVKELANQVEDQPTPLAWSDARRRELLRARDGVRTGEQSSAELEFVDASLFLTEESIVFIGEEKKREQVDRTQIEIVVGQADLEGSKAPAADTGEFEIVLGDATATPRASEDSALQTRARRPEGGGAQLMVYSGESELEAAGTKVTVATGMGSSVPEGEAPKPPEKLLPAPADLGPAAGSGLATPRPAFSWAPVEGARDYTLEICRDARCGVLVERVVGLSEPSWKPAGLPVEKFYWRVTAVAASGLDGYPSDASGFEILSAVEDTEAPEVKISFIGPQLAPRSGLNDKWILGPGMEIEVEVTEDGSGVAEWTPSIDGEEVAVEALKGPWEKGEHTAGFVALDRAGNHREVEVPFIYDPDPPELSWGVEKGSALGEIVGGLDADTSAAAPAYRGRRKMKVGKRTWQFDSDMAEVLVRPRTGKPVGLASRAEGAQADPVTSISRDFGLWVLARDAVCSELDDLRYELVPGPEKGSYALRVQATDCVGNQRNGQLMLGKQRKR